MSEDEGAGQASSSQESAQLLATEIKGIPCFNPKDDPNTLSIRWKRWKRSFNLYLRAKGITMDLQKVALLLHTGGADFQELYYTLIHEDEERSLKESFEVLDNYFLPRVNVPFERHLFRQMSQVAGETVDQFVCRLRQKAVTCDFANVDETIRDQLIEKGRNAKLRRKFLERANASLKDLQDIARAFEAVEVQMKSLEQGDSQHKPGDSLVNSVGRLYKKTKKGNKDGHKDRHDRGTGTDPRCFNCNRTGHRARDSNCPARNQKCNKCGITGHFAACCRKRDTKKPKEKQKIGNESRKEKVYQVDEDEKQRTRRDYAFVVGKDPGGVGEVILMVGGVQLDGVLIDSGASCNLIDYETWSNLKENNIDCQSTKSEKKLFAYAQKEPIEVAGTFVSEIVCKTSGEKCMDEFTVIKGTGKPLLGKSTAEKLKVLHVGPLYGAKVCSVATEGSDTDIRTQYADVFDGVGKLKSYQLKLHINKDVKPVAQGVRRLPFGSRDKVDKKLDDLLEKDIIEEVPSSPTEWVSPLVVVPKPDGDARVCIDMRKANEAIVRERHPIPTIEEILYDLNGATVFSKLDLKWGFHQIELEEQSRDITTFVTHRGFYTGTSG